ncbi:MAG: hypothetical protein M3Z08_19750 [Chloroflexota bacterium]|nr:hypothetical protein [Chloroflexota bacterium]
MPDITDLVQQVPALADSSLPERLLQKRPGPGFLGLDLPHDLARMLLQRLTSQRASGYAIPVTYRQPARISIEQATPIAQHYLAEVAARRYPGNSFGSAHFLRSDPVCCWTFVATSEELAEKGHMGLYASVDKLDGHVWSAEEFEQLHGEA